MVHLSAHMVDIVVDHGQGDADGEDCDNGEGNRRIGDKFVRLDATVDFHGDGVSAPTVDWTDCCWSAEGLNASELIPNGRQLECTNGCLTADLYRRAVSDPVYIMGRRILNRAADRHVDSFRDARRRRAFSLTVSASRRRPRASGRAWSLSSSSLSLSSWSPRPNVAVSHRQSVGQFQRASRSTFFPSFTAPPPPPQSIKST